VLDGAIIYIVLSTISDHLVCVTEMPQVRAVQTTRLIMLRDIISVCYVSLVKYTKALSEQNCH
jgi:hypothetical protein